MEKLKQVAKVKNLNKNAFDLGTRFLWFKRPDFFWFYGPDDNFRWF